MSTFKIEHEGDGFYTIRDVPIFEMHNDRGFPCDETWMANAIENHQKYKKEGWRPTIILGHNIKGQEKEAIGFLDNLVLKGKRLYADLTRIPRMVKEKIIQNAYPSRSVEVLPQSKRIVSLALLGGTTPHFALPQMVYENNHEQSLWYRSPLMAEFSDAQKKELKELFDAALKESSTQFQKAEEPQVYQLTFQEAQALLSSEECPTVYQTADGVPYVTDGTAYYALPRAITNLITRTRVAGRNLRAGAKAGWRGQKRLPGEWPMFRKGENIGAKAHSAVRRAGAVATKAKGKLRAGALPIAAGAGIAGAGAGLLGVGALAGMHRARKNKSQQGYALDEENGVLYGADGTPLGYFVPADQQYEDAEIGMDVPTAPSDPAALPTIAPVTVVPQIDEDDVGIDSDNDPALEHDPGENDEGNSEVVSLGDGDQMGDDSQFASHETATLYDLQQKVERLSAANALMQAGRRAEQYRSWLEEQQKAGVPIGNIDAAVDYMMSQTPEQVAQYKQLLVNSPKVALGRMENTPVSFEATELATDYQQHKDVYSAMGVTDQDLKFSRYVRGGFKG